MSPSKDHERIRGYLGGLVEAYALSRRIRLSPYGSWTLKAGARQAGLEPDECCIVGDDQGKALPDLAIEVVLISGGIDKLEVYRRLGVAEVWFWQAGMLEVHLLRGERYERAAESALFPELDLALVCSLLDQPTVVDAVLAFQERME